MGGKTSAKSKNKWISENLDRINLTMPRGKKEMIRTVAAERGQSTNAFINEAIDHAIDTQKKRESGD